jgi:hypothetical protein
MLLGVTLLTKSTWIILLGLWPLLWLFFRWVLRRRGTTWSAEGAQVVTVLGLALLVLNAGYDFCGSFTLLGDFQFVSRTLRGNGANPTPSHGVPSSSGNRFAGTALATLPVPFPRDFVLGIDVQKVDFEKPNWSYLRGRWRERGWWYYYLYAMAIKEPLGIWGLVLTSVVIGLRRVGRAKWRDEIHLFALGVAVIALVSAQTGFNRHLRYVLPAFPCLFIFASKPFGGLRLSRLVPFLLAPAFLIWAAASSLTVYPHSLSYFNELVGGPTGGHAHLSSSNVDWGQDLIYLREWLQQHPEVKPTGAALVGGMTPELAGISAPLPPREPEPGWYVLSVIRIRDKFDGFGYFLGFRPVAMVGYSIHIYHITPEEANRARRELRLPEIKNQGEGTERNDAVSAADQSEQRSGASSGRRGLRKGGTE